jgi:hypothetical protein
MVYDGEKIWKAVGAKGKGVSRDHGMRVVQYDLPGLQTSSKIIWTGPTYQGGHK